MKSKMLQSFYLFPLLIIVLTVIPISTRTRVSATEGTMGTDEITPGMTGYGKTVFKGDRIETFDIEVLGVLKNWDANSDMVLIKMSGGPLEKSGIIAGMSGSPVYIDNRLIGAVAYGWSFSKEAIAGVTPIGEMKSILLDIPEKATGTTLASVDWALPRSSKKIFELSMQELSFLPPWDMGLPVNDTRLMPILSPLVVSGFKESALNGMEPFFHSCGVTPVQGGTYVTSNPDISEKEKIIPGSSVAAVLIRGDLNAAVVGTVTYVEGDDILAFGHPFLQIGSTDIPMASAYVYTILSSQSNSVKMASPGEIVGSIRQDRRPGIAGTLGKFSRLVPCHIAIDGSQKFAYDFEIVDSKLLTPMLVLMAAQSAVLSTEKKLGERSVHVKFAVEVFEHEKPITIENVFFEYDQSWISLNHVLQSFAMVINNQFQSVRIKKMHLAVAISDNRKTATIESVRVNKKHIRPGGALEIDVQINPFTEEHFYQTVSFKIPEDTIPGSVLTVTACDARHGNALSMGRSAGKYLPTNFKQLVKYVEEGEQNNTLLVRVLLTKKGLTYKGEGFPSLPSSILSIMSFSNQSGAGPLLDEIVFRVPTAYVLNGNQSIKISVE
ncbi:MAG: hypothetical protein MRJ65_02900 [Candidatus Brocadiaceae bacterium]|nr:hypothetical protein [Candidatus Brocadiaceae bacterium]